MKHQNESDFPETSEDKQQPLFSHLLELRERLLKSIYCILAVFLCLVTFSRDIYHWLATPLLQQLPESSTMIATEVASPFLAPFKLTFFVAIIISVPYLLYHAWSFIAPGLYASERKYFLPVLLLSFILFYSGMAFAYWIVFPLLFSFFSATTPEGISMMTDISAYLNFVIKMLLSFGLAFEVPVVTFILIQTGFKSIRELEHYRPYIIIFAFILGMLLTPPDIVSQILLAVPVWLLFETGLVAARIIIKDGQD